MLEWLSVYLIPILISILSVIIGYVIYYIIKKQILGIAKRERLERSTALNIAKVIKYLMILIISTTILIQFAESLGFITALFTITFQTRFHPEEVSRNCQFWESMVSAFENAQEH